ncbi:hypothetical protein Sjap_004260 [Stephania japonica]|uniref:Phosphatidylserine decarboxylase proenzyme 1, mitochondrial n=1 Tax=Stephania japonica TaxID=461633 RepID=A0AAP0K1Z0_9MAGN
MKIRVSPKWAIFPNHEQSRQLRHIYVHRFRFSSLSRSLQATRASSANGGHGSSEGNSFLLPGATVATVLMLGVLHARRMYDDKKVRDVEEAKEKGIEPEFSPDVKASFLKLLPLRSISRAWGSVASMELPVWLRPYVYKAWARAFHSNLDEVALPLDQYASLRDFFVRALKEGLRPIDSDPRCLVSPVDGTILIFGELEGLGAMIEQVKGTSYSASSLLGASSFLYMNQNELHGKKDEGGNSSVLQKKSWWRISFASPKVPDPPPVCPAKGIFYCVIYLRPGDYHRIHSPADWQVLVRRHFSGELFPVHERGRRTIKNLYVENERVVLEGQWAEGLMALAAVGAATIGSIELKSAYCEITLDVAAFIEPELQTNRPNRKLLHSEPPQERIYEPDGVGVILKKGEELAAFNMGSTVVLVFQAPSHKTSKDIRLSEFNFCIDRGDKVRVGEALGRHQSIPPRAPTSGIPPPPGSFLQATVGKPSDKSPMFLAEICVSYLGVAVDETSWLNDQDKS